MKKWCLASLVLMAAAAHAQAQSSKSELVNKILKLQQPAIEQVAQSLAERPAVQLMQQASVALQTRVAPEKRDAAAKAVQADLKKYADEVGPLVRQKAVQLAPSTVGALLEQRFTEDELKQLVSIIESPVNIKYQQMGGDLQKVLAEKLVTETQVAVQPKVKALEQAITTHLGLPPVPQTAVKPALGASGAKK